MQSYSKVVCVVALAMAAMAGSGHDAVAQRVAAPAVGQSAAPGPDMVVDYWIGDLTFSGQAREDSGIGFSGSSLNFNIGRTENVSGQARITLWIDEDGIARRRIGDCVAAMFPEKAGTTIETGGLFKPDLAYVGTSPRCGMAQGEEVVSQTNRITPHAEGLLYAYTGENTIQQPFKGKVSIKGEVILRPVYKSIAPPAQLASTGSAGAAPAVELHGLAKIIDAVIQVDSRGWMFNRYDVGSVSSERFLEQSADGKNAVAYGEYTYNGGSRGWIKIRLTNGEVECMEYFDFAGRCRPAGTASYGSQLALDLMVSAMAAPSSSSYGDGSAGQTCTDVIGGLTPEGRPIRTGIDCR